MLHDRLAQDLYSEICRIPLIDSHTHIDPRHPTATNLDDILGYHYYTELAHSSGMDHGPLVGTVEPRERVRAILYQMACFDNTAQYEWFLEICRAFLNFQGSRITIADSTALCDAAEKMMGRSNWQERVLRLSNIEKIFLTNEFDDSLEGFDTERYVPCLRTDDLVFQFHRSDIRKRLAERTGVEVGDGAGMRRAVRALFEHFTRHGAKACAISLPPNFSPREIPEDELTSAFRELLASTSEGPVGPQAPMTWANGVFWMLAEHCREFKLPFDLMMGVNRRVYPGGVYQGQDLFDQRTSLSQYALLFNTFPTVTFCISVLSSNQNQELCGYSWIFPNVMTSGHWWYSNIPAFIHQDLRARLESVPKTKQIGYYSDMYKLEMGLPKFNMYRRVLAQTLADDFVRPHHYNEAQSVELARLLLRDNPRRIFNV